MNHLISFNELKTSTYLSAAEKLRDFHKERSDELRKHAKRFGTKDNSKLEDPSNYFTHRYPFEIKKIEDGGDYDNGIYIDDFFYITGYKEGENGYNLLSIVMHSNSDSEIEIVINSSFDNKISLVILQGRRSSAFRFSNRKDAVIFRNFLISEFPEIGNKLNINDMYGKFYYDGYDDGED